jgi:DNA-binding transcriptional MerR regulator
MKTLVSESDASHITGLSPRTLLRRRRAGLLPFERDKDTGRISYRLVDLEGVTNRRRRAE